MVFTPIKRAYISHDAPPMLSIRADLTKARVNATAVRAFGLGPYQYIQWSVEADRDTLAVVMLERREADSYKIGDSSGGIEFHARNLATLGNNPAGKYRPRRECVTVLGVERVALTFKLSERIGDTPPRDRFNTKDKKGRRS